MKLTKEELDKLIDKRIEERGEEAKAAGLNKESEEIVDESVESLKKEVEKLREELKKPVDKKVIGGEPEKKEWKCITDFVRSVRAAMNGEALDPRLVPSEAKTAGHFEEGQDSLGGFLVPDEYRTELLQLALEESVVRRANPFVIPTARDSVTIPRIIDTSHASSVFGGVQCLWTPEAADFTEKHATFGQVKLMVKKLTAFTYISDELLADSAVPMDPLIKRLFAQAIGYFEDDAFIAGTGAAQPMGIRTAACLVPVTRNSTNHFQIEDVANMMARLLPGSYGRAVWMISPAVLPEIIWMENASSGTGGHCVYISQDQGIAKSPFPISIMGRPVFVTEKVPTLGTANDVMLVDFGYYVIADRQDLAIETSREYRFLNNETTYRLIKRVDGQPWLLSALTPRNSGNTLSPIVGLAA